MDPTLLLTQVFNGVSVGSLYLLAALGLALSFGLMRVVNMAHGEMLMLGGYVAWGVTHAVPGPLGLVLALPAAFVAAVLLGAVVHLLVVRRLLGRPLDTLLATWGVSLILQQAARSLFGAIGVEVVAPAWLAGEVAGLPAARLFILALAVLVLVGLALLLARTSIGLQIRAVNQDRMMAAASGIDVGRVELVVFGLGTGVAGLAGVLLALLGPVTPTVGQAYIVPAFLVVVVGGLGSVLGTVIAALMLGLVAALAQIAVDVSLAQVILLVFVVLFIQWRPQGVIASRTRVLDA